MKDQEFLEYYLLLVKSLIKVLDTIRLIIILLWIL
jgi:hypothetical protein